MVHADASTFHEGVTKDEAFEQVLEQIGGLMYEQRNWVCILSNTASLLWHAFHSMPGPSVSVNWSGFYVIDPSTPEQLILAPFIGKVGCQTIRFNRGVCGKAASTGETQVVHDVHAVKEHIACDSETSSEIVVPITSKGRLVGVIDVDSTLVGTFDETDKLWLERIAGVLGEGLDW